MDLKDELRKISSRVPLVRGQLQTAEATKTALVMPFIRSLGYDVFDPLEVVPEFTADHGTKKGEKVDYAIMKDGHPIILVECKTIGTDLSKVAPSQLGLIGEGKSVERKPINDVNDIFQFAEELQKTVRSYL